MGDHRASIKITFEMHGIKEETDMWINWSPDPSEGDVDRRVVEFFENAARKAMDKYNEELYEYEREAREKEQEKKEREELARLRAKYESPNA